MLYNFGANLISAKVGMRDITGYAMQPRSPGVGIPSMPRAGNRRALTRRSHRLGQDNDALVGEPGEENGRELDVILLGDLLELRVGVQGRVWACQRAARECSERAPSTGSVLGLGHSQGGVKGHTVETGTEISPRCHLCTHWSNREESMPQQRCPSSRSTS
jgi:hypothetical protein